MLNNSSKISKKVKHLFHKVISHLAFTLLPIHICLLLMTKSLYLGAIEVDFDNLNITDVQFVVDRTGMLKGTVARKGLEGREEEEEHELKIPK